MPEPLTLTAVGSVARLLAPVLNGLYSAAKGPVKSKIESWKAGGDLERIAEYYVRLASVKTIFSREEALSIESFYYPSRVSLKARVNVIGNLRGGLIPKVVNGLNDLPEGCIVVEGVVGQGKSIFMRYLALSILSDHESGRIPIFVEFRNVSDKNSITDLIWQAFEAIGVKADEDVLAYLSKEKKLVLLLDGFDEVAHHLVADTLVEINRLKNNNSGLRVVVSSRPRNAIQNVSDFKILALEPLRSIDHDAFLKKLGVDSVKRVELLEAIKSSPADVQGAISTPLMMSIVVLVYESMKQIPPYLSDFFSALFHVVFTQHDSLKEAFRRKHHTGLSESRLQYLFEAFCFVVMQKSYGRTLSVSRFNECFEKALKYVPNVECSVEDFRSDIIKVACLMLEEGVGEATFLHKGILDYFAAAFAARLESLSENFYKSVSSSYDEWKVTLHFLEKIDHHRYLKFYYLRVVGDELDSLTAALSSFEDSDAEAYVSKLYDQVSIRRQDSIITFNMQGIARNELAEAAADACSEVISDFSFDQFSRERLKDLALAGRKQISIGDDYVDLSLGAVIELFGFGAIREALAEVENDFSSRLLAAERQLDAYEEIESEIDMSFEI